MLNKILRNNCETYSDNINTLTGKIFDFAKPSLIADFWQSIEPGTYPFLLECCWFYLHNVANTVIPLGLIIVFFIMCKTRLKCSLGSLARLSTLSQSYLLMILNIYLYVVLVISC